MPDPDAIPPTDPLGALRVPAFRRYLLGAFAEAFGGQVRTAAVGWDLYARTGSALVLGYVGLVLALPVLLLALPAGAAADRYSRRGVLAGAGSLLFLANAGLAAAALARAPLPVVYALLLLAGIGSAFQRPASQALVPGLVPPRLFPNAAKWSSLRWQLGAALGPLAAGVLLATTRSAAVCYAVSAAGSALFVAALATVRAAPYVRAAGAASLAGILDGARFVWREPVLLAALTLDMVAVLFGGATALLPVYATDVLGVGAAGFGWLRAMPSVGAVAMALALTVLPPFRRTGRVLLAVVAAFGVATLVFGGSRSYGLSLAALFALGAADNVSAVIRATLLQVLTPDALRGRVGAVNAVFIGTSNEIGEFESGVAAHLLGPVAAVVLGGTMTLVTVGWVAWKWPALLRLGPLEALRPKGVERGA